VRSLSFDRSNGVFRPIQTVWKVQTIGIGDVVKDDATGSWKVWCTAHEPTALHASSGLVSIGYATVC
jgi:hypothetical protein